MRLRDKLRWKWKLWWMGIGLMVLPDHEVYGVCQAVIDELRGELQHVPAGRQLYQALGILDDLENFIIKRFKR